MAFDTDSTGGSAYTGTGASSDVYTDDGVNTSRADSTDEVNIRKLVREPELNDIRWVYRNTFAKKIIDKPVDDAFKNGFDIKNDPTNSIESFLDRTGYIETYKRAEKKARRDGFALIFFVLSDGAEGPYESVDTSTRTNVKVHKCKQWTIDDLTDAHPSGLLDTLSEQFDRDYGQRDIEVRDKGYVISRDLGDPLYGEPLGVMLDRENQNGEHGQFVHRDRLQFLVWNDEVDGDYRQTNSKGQRTLGEWEGDSVLQPAFHYIKDSFKGTWAVMQTLFRHSSPLYKLNLPDRAGEDDVKDARENFKNLNATDEAVLPADYELDVLDQDGALEIEGYFDAIFDEICASTEMTKSVLFGTQSGTVSGSETDVKNYFNKVARMRQTRFESNIDDYVRRASTWSKKEIPTFALGYSFDWGPLFRLSELDAAEVRSRDAQTMKMLMEMFAFHPDEAREVINRDWDLPIDLDDLDEEKMAELENFQFAQVGAEQAHEKSEKGNPQVGQNGGGMESGQSTASEDPASDSVSYEW